MFLLIIGCGRSGTQFTSALLQANGLDVGHELVGEDGIISGDLGAFRFKQQTKATRGISPNEAWRRRTHVFHQVRSPLKAICSMATIGDWSFIEKACPTVNQGTSLITRAMRYWLFWNRQCQGLASWTYRVEAFPAACREFSKRLKRRIVWKPTPNTINSRKHLTHYPKWEERDLWDADKGLCRAILNQAKQYGYKGLSE